MKLLQINTSLNTSSTGKIVNQIGDMCIKNGDESYIMYSGRYSSSISKSITYKIGTRLDFYLHAFITRVFDNHGFASNRATKKMLKNIEIIKPDVIHLHNLHGYYLNVEILFQYLQTSKAKIVWTLHDCWSFTGHCSHFDYVGCVKWMTACNNCPQKTSYPSSLILDNSEMNFENKKKLFNSIDISNMTIVPVSKWLKTKVEKSFLKSFNSRVINNGIDLNIFKQLGKNFLNNHKSLRGKFILLGVASVWTERKGLYEFIKLRGHLDDSFAIVLVGISPKLQKKLPKNIFSIERTTNQEELASIYSCADLYLNLTFEDTYPSTNLESIACGTPVITYRTGGSPESVYEGSGFLIEQGDVTSLVDKIIELKNSNSSKLDSKFLNKVAMNNFNKDTNFIQYLELYKEILKAS
jgi:glycosyltransferase involved in cell wall biosynthesis